MRKISILLIIIFNISVIYSQYTDEINSRRPGNSMSAFAIGRNVFQIEAGGYGIVEDDNKKEYSAQGYGTDIALRIGFFRERLEGVVEAQYQKENYTEQGVSADIVGLRKAILGVKYLLYDPNKYYEKEINIYSWKANHKYDWHKWVPTLSFYAGTNFSQKNNPYFYTPNFSVAPKAMLITQNNFESDEGIWVLVTNIVADRLMTDYANYGYIISLTNGISDRFSIFGENEMMFGNTYSDYNLKFGCAYLVARNFQIDASVCSSIKTTPYVAYGGVGFSWRYDKKHIPQLLLSSSQQKQFKMAKKNAKKKRKLERKNAKKMGSKNKGFDKAKEKRAKELEKQDKQLEKESEKLQKEKEKQLQELEKKAQKGRQSTEKTEEKNTSKEYKEKEKEQQRLEKEKKKEEKEKEKEKEEE